MSNLKHHSLSPKGCVLSNHKTLWQGYGQWRQWFVLLLALVLVTVPASLVHAGTLTLGVTLVGDPDSVQTGETVEYIIDFSCGGTTGDCGDLDIYFQLDSELTYLEVIYPPGYAAEEDPVGSGIIHIQDLDTFYDGEAAQVTVRAIVSQDLDDLQLDAEVTGTISVGSGTGSETITVIGPEVPIEIPEGGWTTSKSRTSPGGSLGPIEDGNATYEVEVCPTGDYGAARLETVTFTDTFAAGATVVSNPDGGTVTGNTITWTLDFTTGTPPYHTVDDGCVSVTYTLNYPSTIFSYGDDITNNYVVEATTPTPDEAFDGVCGTDCVGTGSNGGTIDPPSVTAGGDKTGPGTTAIVAPGTSNGYSTFDLSWNLSNANTSTTDFIFTDVLPVAASDGIPVIEISAFTSGTWSGGYSAAIQITTVSNPTWTTLATVDGSTNVTYTSGVDYPATTSDLITGIRWNFTGSTVPAGFSGSNIELQFYVRAGMDASDYDDGSGYHDYDNCLSFSGSYDDQYGVSQPIAANTVCETLRIGEDTTDGFTNIRTSKSSSTTAVYPGQDIQFTLTLDLTQEASGNLINPLIQDTLPFGMQIVSWDSVTLPSGITTMPYLAVDTVNGTHPVTGAVETVQRLRFYWDDDTVYPATSYTCGSFPCTMDTDISTFTLDGVTATTPPAGANGISVAPPDTGVETIQIQFTAQVRVDTPATDDGVQIDYGNETVVVTDVVNLVCQTGTTSTEIGDVDEDGITAEVVCETSSDYNVREAAQMNSQKWIRNTDAVASNDFLDSLDLDSTPSASYCPTYTYGGNTYTRYPCVAQGLPGSSFEYLLRVQNTGLVNTDEYIMYDILPHEPDYGVSEALESEARLTEFRVFLTGPIVYANPLVRADAPTFTVEYYEETGVAQYNPCRPQMSEDFAEAYGPASCGAGTWTTTPTYDAGTGTYPYVTAWRITQSNSGTGYIAPGEQLLFTVPMEIDDTPGEAETGEISWNTFAQRFSNFASDARLLTAEPRKVGIVVEPRYSVGNRVWIDDGTGGGTANNGIRDGGEVGLNGVTVELWQNDNGAGWVLYSTDVTRQDTGTNEDGFYFFGDLPGGSDIQYQVRIPASEFAGGPLDEYISSTGEVQSATTNGGYDERDNGPDPADVADYDTAGISSDSFTLTDNDEFTGETVANTDGVLGDPQGNNESTTGRGETYESDGNSDLTVDFGFFKPMSIGNRVWLDDGAGGGVRNDGIINGSEIGIADVVLRLYASDGTTPIDEPGNPGTPYEVTTDANGYYLFDLLPPGQYVVRVMPENFQFGATPADDGPLADYISSNAELTTGAAESPVDENGIEYGYAVDEEDDRTDHGIDPATDGAQRTDGVYSAVITLTPDSETTSEQAADVISDGRRSTASNSDLTVDFGFFQEDTSNFSLGNVVWEDIDNDGVYDAGETPMGGVEMALWSVDAGGNPDTQLYTTTTLADGSYVFANLDPGRYIVQMTAANWYDANGNGDFDAGDGVLVGYISSTGNAGDTETDHTVDENGVDPTDDNTNNTVTDEYAANGVYSVPILLEPEGEPTGEAVLLSGDGGAEDDNSDLTVDFGVYRPMSIGNIVWLDSGATATGIDLTQYNDGIRNGTEPGISGVTVQLYRDVNGDGTPETLYATTTTDTNGYYLFDGLPPGNYRVEIPTSNFTGAPLQNLVSSYDAAAPTDADLDDDDHGIDVADPTANPVVSPTIVLAYDSEPLETNTAAAGGDPDSSNNALDGPNYRGNNGETDDNSDRTVDFGFVAPPMSIGNRVFFDSGDNGTNPTQYNDGIQNGTEPGIDGVTVNLYAASDLTTPILTTTTVGGGYYLFDDLPPGDYVVGIPASNFSGPLAGYVSSTGNAGDDQTDLDDNGINPATVGGEVFSPTITLSTNNEPTADDEAVTGTNGGTLPDIDDNDSDLTVDFGFIRPMSIGNRVWLDTDRTTGVPGDGTRQSGEVGIGGVTVELYLDNGTVAGVLDAGDTLVAQTITTITGTPANDGYYLFDETTTVTAPGVDDPNNSPIGPGDYLVHIPASNFAAAAPLEGLINSDGANGSGTDTQTDSDTGDENGVNATPGTPATYPVNAGVTSTTIALRYDTEPTSTTETNRDPLRTTDVDGVGVEDDNGDFTVDFGFYYAVSIGNRVWYDTNRDGLIDAGDDNPAAPGNPGIDGVTVYLYYDADGDGTLTGAETTPIATDVTANGGYYLFDEDSGGNLLPGGSYIVGVDTSTGGLTDHVSTLTRNGGTNALDGDDDSDDNGIDTIPTGIIYSEAIALEHFTETVLDTDKGPEGDGNGIQDYNSNLTVDFGFYIPMSIGNRVWLDNGAGGGVADDGIQNGTEPGIQDVWVTLYYDTDGSGDFSAADTPVDSPTSPGNPYRVQTDANGYYIFDGLTEGDYIVWVDDVNFQGGGALESYDSSPGDDQTDGTDLNDNGIDVNYPAIDGIASDAVNLTVRGETTTEADLGPDGDGTHDETADNSDLTLDFGFNTPFFSLGNRVWFDPNNDGLIDVTDTPLPGTAATTPGIPGVRVDLYLDTGDGIPQAAEYVTMDTTDANGYYLFENLPAGNYIVVLNENNFRTGGVLVDLYSSTGNAGDDQIDNDDNGVDSTNPQVGGIQSEVIELSKNNEPLTDLAVGPEDDLSNNPADGPDFRGNNGELDSNSDLTVDFGLYKPMSIGNRVWFDINNNGLIDGTESGIQNVTVNLYRDNDGDGTPETLVATDYTNVDGYYLFDNLTPGDYLVEIDASNFAAGTGVLEGLFSSSDTNPTTNPGEYLDTVNGVDSNDNGIDDATPEVNGIRSNVINLSFDGEQIDEADLGPENIGANGETDDNSDVTIDFGFVAEVSSLGNRVWLDPNNSGTMDVYDGTSPGIANVTVSLYRDANTDGIPDGPAIQTDVTDANGYYLFDLLTPGNYIVGLNNSNFNPGGALEDLISSTGNAADNQTDLDDNGIDTLNATYGLLSPTINIASNAEPVGEVDLSGDAGDGPDSRGNNGETDDNSDLTVDFGLYEPMSLGNRVWFDTDNSGTLNGTEGGASGVTVSLYYDTNGDGVPDAPVLDATGTPLTDTTDTNGYYLFDGLGEGDYVVVVDATNFQPGGALENLISSTGNATNNIDRNDNGVDPVAAADYLTDGVRSNSINLTLHSEPTNDTDLGPDGHGTNGETNNNSDLSIDFGFYGAQMSLGNRVWIDDGAGGGTARDGIRDAGEVTVDGVRVSLYWDTDNDGVPDGAAIATDVTSGGGYYLFDGLAPGNYIVGLDSYNFGSGRVLEGYGSTTTGPVDTDDNDNGIDGSSPELNGILSSTIVLERDNEPTGETDISAVDGMGAGGSDENSNLTVDFGLYKSLSIGNRVWFDVDDNGLIDAGESGIAGVTVSLYEDANGDGVPDGPAIATDTTDTNGYYLFDGLEPGNYIVGIDVSNFNPTNALDGFASSTGDTNDITDSNDNGIDLMDAVYGILSDTVTLTRNGTPTHEADTSGDAANDGPNFRGTNAESDNNSDLTVDFGFVAGVMSLGNRVWLDDGAGGGTSNNGIQDGGELGIAGVVVNLYPDSNGDGSPDGAAIATDTTDANGYYLFDGIAPGHYVIQILPTNFQSGNPLHGYLSSTGNNLTITDMDDNGIDSSDPAGTGIFSQSIHLIANNAPTGEADLSGDAGDGPDSRGTHGETDENSDLTFDFGFVVQYDWGDAPDSYHTTAGSNGPSHQIVPDLFLGQRIDDETSGVDSSADGDDSAGTDDEDGVIIPDLVAGTTVNVEVTVYNNTGSDATLIGWIDFNGDGDFDSSEAVTVTVPSNSTEQVIQVPFDVPPTADTDTGGTTYARFRLTTDSSIDDSTPDGPADDGEVEDYEVTVLQPGISITKSDNLNSMQPGTDTTYTITITNSGTDVVNGWVVDAIPIDDPDGFDPSTVTWTCVATDGASCIHGDPAGTPSSGTGQIDERVDLPRGSTLVYEITGTLRDDYSQDFLTNEASIEDPANPGPVSDDDVNGIITDPPYGVKTGVLRDNNIIRWTMTWYNTGALQQATVSDTIRAGQTFNGNLICTAHGVSNTDSCTESGGVITWTGQIGTGNPNRVDISFDVLIQSDGTYRNVGSIVLGSGVGAAGSSVATASGRVRVGTSGDDDDDDDDDDVAAVATAIPPEIMLSKSVNPMFARPGDVVEWVITASNIGTTGATSITITDSVPDELEILSASASYGTPTVSGQQVSLFIAWLGPGQSVTITLQTRIRSDVEVPFNITNLAYIEDLASANARIISIESLPNTGESPWSGWRIILFGAGILSVGITGVIITTRRRKRFEM